MKDTASRSLFDTHDAVGLGELVKSGEVTAEALLDEAIERVEHADSELKLLAARDYEFAREQIANGLPDGPFTGVPFLRKDEGCDIEGLVTTGGLKLLKDNVAQQPRTLAKRYMGAGLVMMGATKVPPFCATIDTDRSPYGATFNPWDKSRTPGGSSSGAGAVVGAGALPMAHGNDGGGSLRIPSAWCGAFTMKPSRGRVNNGPIYAEGWMGFSTEGTITRSVRDGAVSLDVIMGSETGVRCVAPPPARPYGEEIRHDCRKLRIAVQENSHFGTEFHPDHQKALAETVTLLESLGHEVVSAAPKIDCERLSQVLYNCVAVNVDTVLQDIGTARGKPVENSELETFIQTWRNAAEGVTASDYARITEVAMEEAYSFDLFMQDYDAVLSPTMAEPPLKIGEIYRHEADFEAFRQHQNKYLAMTQVQNVTGQPAMSVPLHWSDAGLPIGMMFVGRYGDESTLFSLAAQLEKAQPWWDRKALF